MSEYRTRNTGEILTQGQLRQRFSNTSLPRTWGANVHEALGIDPVIASKPPEPSTNLKVIVRDGLVQNSNGQWLSNWIERDKFAEYTSEDGVVHTKAEQEADYQATLDAKDATANRKTRNDLLDTSDWTQMNDSPLTNELKTAWATYRQELRGLTDADAWPNLAEDDWPVAP